MPPKILIPDEIIEQIVAARGVIERQVPACAQARAQINSEISRLESAAVQTQANIERLKNDAPNSDAASAALVNSERRATAICDRLADLKAKRAALPAVDLFPAFRALGAIASFYREALAEQFAAHVRHFDFPEHVIPHVLAHAGAYRTLNIIRDWLTTVPPANRATITRLSRYFDAALAGQICLHRNPSPAPADTLCESQATQSPDDSPVQRGVIDPEPVADL